MSKKLNLILAVIIIAISLSALGSGNDKKRKRDWDFDREFLDYDKLAKQFVVATIAGGAVGYALRDKGTGTKATISVGVGALAGWGVNKWQHRKILDGMFYDAIPGNCIRCPGDIIIMNPRQSFLLSRWRVSWIEKLYLQCRSNDLPNPIDDGPSYKHLPPEIKARSNKMNKYLMSRWNLTAKQSEVKIGLLRRAYESTIEGQLVTTATVQKLDWFKMLMKPEMLGLRQRRRH